MERSRNSTGSSPNPQMLTPSFGLNSRRHHQQSDLTILKGDSARDANQSAFLALQNTVLHCIPVVLPLNKVATDAQAAYDCDLAPLTPRQRMSSNENISANFRTMPVQFGKVTTDQIRRWEADFTFLLHDPDGIALFDSFLKSEFSQENLQFWQACEQYRRTPAKMLTAESQRIYQLYISVQSPREVNLDSKTRLKTIGLLSTPTSHLYDNAQRKIQALMEKDSYQRFLRSAIFLNFKRSVLETTKQQQPQPQQRLPKHRTNEPPSINSAFPSVFQVSTLPLGRKPLT